MLGFVKAGFYQVSMTREQGGKGVGSAVSYCAGPRSKKPHFIPIPQLLAIFTAFKTTHFGFQVSTILRQNARALLEDCSE